MSEKVKSRSSQLVGFLVLRESTGSLDQLFITPALQHQGIGTLLLNKAKALSPGGLVSPLRRSRAIARHAVFMRSMGFSRDGSASILTTASPLLSIVGLLRRRWQYELPLPPCWAPETMKQAHNAVKAEGSHIIFFALLALCVKARAEPKWYEKML